MHPIQQLGYDIFPSPFGALLMAATPRGVCRVKVGNEERTLISSLQNQYPNVQIKRDPDSLEMWGTGLVRYLNHGGDLPSVPVDLAGTPFQKRVWRALQTIPPGSTRSYGEIANQISSPRAYQAVGQACGANRSPYWYPAIASSVKTVP